MPPRLRIALIAPPWFEVPPRGYGGIEAICAWLADGLTNRGHDVVLIGCGAGVTSARFVSTFESPASNRQGDPLIEALHVARAGRFLQSARFDVVHDHTLFGALQAGSRSAPTVVTVHDSVAGDKADYFRALGSSVSLVAVSEWQRSKASDLNWLTTVHNGIPVAEYPFEQNKEEFVLFLGSVRREKGAHVAIDAARAVGAPLIMAGKCSEPAETAYFEEEIRYRLGDDVEWIGEADSNTKKALLANAKCLLFPSSPTEAFGLVMVEAMACGTPVVTFGDGVAKEIVLPGVTGFLCEGFSELAGALENVDSLSPGDCRTRAVELFDVNTMVERYEQAFMDVTGCRREHRGSPLV